MAQQTKYPFKFLDAYAREDRDIFFGRDEEVEALYQMVFQTDLILVYGASGTGKTSLIQCGLASKFQTYEWLALSIRRGDNLNESLEKALAAYDDPETPASDDLDWLTDSSETPAQATESPAARRLKNLYLRHFKPVFLIFDQFEELYILGTKAEQNRFVDTVREILRIEQPVKVLISIREEYLGYLYEFERKVPELLRKKLRIEPMNLEKVQTVVQGISRLPYSNVHLQQGAEAAIGEGIFEKLKERENVLSIELPYLQVFLDKLYLQITGDRSRQAAATITVSELQKMGDIGDVLRNFLDDQVQENARALGVPPDTIKKLLSPFVTLDGTKEPLSADQLHARLPELDTPFIARSLQAFQNSRILRFDEKEQRYEVAHDSLARQIATYQDAEDIALQKAAQMIRTQMLLDADRREVFSEKQLLFMEPYLPKLELSGEEQVWLERSRAHWEEENRRIQRENEEKLEEAQRQAEQERQLRTSAEQAQKRSRQRTRIALFVALLALAGLGVASWQYNLAKRATQNAKTSERAALLAEDKARESEQAALDSAAVAQQQRQIANDRVLETLRANENTADALRKLEITADQAMSIVLPDIDRNIYRLEYDLTYPKCRTAINLKARRGEVEKRIWEMAWFYTETDSAAAAIAFLNLLKPLDFKANAPNIQAKLRTYLAEIIPADYMDSLQTRYYPKTILVEGGSFLREDSARVRVNTFRMGHTEITYWQYNLFAQAENYHIEPPSWEYAGDNPAVYVNWFDAAFYLNWLSERHGKQKVYKLSIPQEGTWATVYDVEILPNTNGYRLPTEAEWEFAARGGNKTQGHEYSGSGTLDETGWYSDNSNSRTHPVGQKKANELGLYDMSGNVWEWCRDWYDDYDAEKTDNPIGPDEDGTYRVVRGGSWDDYPEFCRVAVRGRGNPDLRNFNIGFRLVFVP
jgi:formylglycine-generating enzyme required for sulfatase activity